MSKYLKKTKNKKKKPNMLKTFSENYMPNGPIVTIAHDDIDLPI